MTVIYISKIVCLTIEIIQISIIQYVSSSSVACHTKTPKTAVNINKDMVIERTVEQTN